MLSIVIPTLNEAAALGSTLAAARAVRGETELICADGGSIDGTVALARAHGARVVAGPPGRGAQLHAGAEVARGDVCWFLHADTLAPTDAAEQIGAALTDPRVAGGNFRLRFSGASRGARFLTTLYPRLAWLGLRYGDSGYFVRRTVYARAGGFRPLPLFEDLDFLRRARRCGRFCTVPGPLVTSSRRFEEQPFARVFARWVVLQVAYWLGGDPRRLARGYHRAAEPARPEAPRILSV